MVLTSEAALDLLGVVAGLLGASSMALGVVLAKRWGRPPAYFVWLRGLERLPEKNAAFLSLVSPVVAVLVGAVMLGELFFPRRPIRRCRSSRRQQ